MANEEHGSGGIDVDEAVAARHAMAKAIVVGGEIRDTAASNVMRAVDESERRFGGAGAIEPPYNPVTLAGLLEHSNALRQNVDAYATNIDGFGHRFEPVIDMAAPDAEQRIAQAMFLERQRKLADPLVSAETMLDVPLVPTAEEVKLRKAEIVQQMRAEKTRLDHFFEFCCDDMSFVSMRRKLRQDLETTGNAFAEVLRDGVGEVAEFTYIPSFTVRLLPLDNKPVESKAKVRVSEIEFTNVKKSRVFRKYVQVYENTTVFFKEYGDPRHISKLTGKVFETEEAIKRADPQDAPATEVLHFKIHSPRSAYGVPRWIGNLIAVLGSRQAEEVNFLYFENKSIPPMAVLVSGGRLTQAAVQRLESYIETEIKGKKNFHKILILEAEAAGGAMPGMENPGKMTIELKPLTDAQMKDALFQNYDERNIDKIGMAFRLPRLLRGDVRDFNRATADAALDFAEQQVFSPEREEFDFTINRKVLSDLGIKFWKFKSNAPTVKDQAQLVTGIKDLMTAGAITPEEGRELAADVFGKEFVPVKAAWAKQPMPMTLAGIMSDDTGNLVPFIGDGSGILGEQTAAFGDTDADGTLDPNLAAAARAGQSGMLRLTATALGSVTSVNEARAANGLGPLTLPDGSVDPDGYLTVQGYAEKRAAENAMRAGGQLPPGFQPPTPPAPAPVAVQMNEGGDAPLVAPGPNAEGPVGTMTLQDFQQAGRKLPAHDVRLRALRARRPVRAPEQNAVVAAVKGLLDIRDTLSVAAEAEEATRKFAERQRAVLGKAAYTASALGVDDATMAAILAKR